MADTYTVVRQQQTVGRLPDDTFGSVVRITFRTTSGTVGSVDVPAEHYTADTARTAIERRVQHLEEVDNL